MNHRVPTPICYNPPFRALVRCHPASLDRRYHRRDGKTPTICPCPFPATCMTAHQTVSCWHLGQYNQERLAIHRTMQTGQSPCMNKKVHTDKHIQAYMLALAQSLKMEIWASSVQLRWDLCPKFFQLPLLLATVTASWEIKGSSSAYGNRHSCLLLCKQKEFRVNSDLQTVRRQDPKWAGSLLKQSESQFHKWLRSD